MKTTRWQRLPASHDYGETNGREDGGKDMDVVEMTKDEFQLLYSTAMTDIIGGQLREAEFRQQLLDKDDETNGGDEAAQEGFGQDAVEETQTKKTGQENGGASNTSNDATDSGMHDGIVISTTPFVYTALDDAPDKQRARSLGPQDHLRSAAEQRVAERIEDKGVEPTYRWDVGEVVGERQGHGQVHAGYCQGGYKIALEKGQFVLTQPY